MTRDANERLVLRVLVREVLRRYSSGRGLSGDWLWERLTEAAQ